MDNKTTVRTFDSQTKYEEGGQLNIDSIFNANRKIEWVDRLYDEKPQTIQIQGEKYPSTHLLEQGDNFVYPTIIKGEDGKLKHLKGKWEAYDYAMKTKTAIPFKNEEEARWFSENYKKGKGVLPKQEQDGFIRTSKSGRKFTYPSIEQHKQEIINKIMTKTQNKPDD